MERSHGRITVKGSDAKLMWGRRGESWGPRASHLCLPRASRARRKAGPDLGGTILLARATIVSQGRYSSELKEMGFEGGECHSLNVVY